MTLKRWQAIKGGLDQMLELKPTDRAESFLCHTSRERPAEAAAG
jgi:hypothetical protein